MMFLGPRYMDIQNSGLFLKQPRYQFFLGQWIVLLFLPIAFLAKLIYPWMGDLIKDPKHIDHALKAKAPLFTKCGSEQFWPR